MPLTVGDLIKELKKYPKTSYVGYQAHDNDEEELSGIVHDVFPFDPDTSFDPDYCKNIFVILQG